MEEGQARPPPRIAGAGEPKRREGGRQVSLALGPHHLPWSQPSPEGRALAHQRVATAAHVVANHTGSLPGLLANVAQLDRKASQLRVGSGRAGPAVDEPQLEDGPRLVLGGRRRCPDTTAGEHDRQRDGKAAARPGRPAQPLSATRTTAAGHSRLHLIRLRISTSGSNSSQVPWLAALQDNDIVEPWSAALHGLAVMRYSSPMTTLADRLLPEALWQRIQPLLPPPPSHARGGAPRTVPDRACMAAIVFMARTSTPWALLPVGEFGCGSVSTCWRRFAEWAAAGVFDRLQGLLLDELGAAGLLDWSRASVDSASLRAVRGGPDRRKPGRPGQARVQVAPGGGHHRDRLVAA